MSLLSSELYGSMFQPLRNPSYRSVSSRQVLRQVRRPRVGDEQVGGMMVEMLEVERENGFIVGIKIRNKVLQCLVFVSLSCLSGVSRVV